MRSRFERLSKPELDFLKENCNFSKDEIIILHMASVGESEIQIADKLKKDWKNLKVSWQVKKV